MPSLRIWSDLHLEFAGYKFGHIYTPSPLDKDTTLILAGDIGVGMQGQEFINTMCENFKNVIRILGNHEFYHNDFSSVIKGWAEFENNGPKNFHFLNNDWRIVDGVRFLGGTMWTSLNDGDYLTRMNALREMNDYVEITSGGAPITPDFIIGQHDEFIKFLITEFDKPFDGKTVVITHHSPGNEVRRRGYSVGLLSHAYFADIEDLVGYHDKCVLHIHGHVHESYDYMINNTRVICNPYGYSYHKTNPNFDKNLIIEI